MKQSHFPSWCRLTWHLNILVVLYKMFDGAASQRVSTSHQTFKEQISAAVSTLKNKVLRVFLYKADLPETGRCRSVVDSCVVQLCRCTDSTLLTGSVMKLKLKIAAKVVSESGSDVNLMRHLYLTHSGITNVRTGLDMLTLCFWWTGPDLLNWV